MTASGVGPVLLGMPQRALKAQAGAPDADSSACAFVVPDGAPPGVRAMIVGGEVRRLDIIAAGVPTAAGVGVGSSEAELSRAYPDARTLPRKYTSGHQIEVVLDSPPPAARRLVFETDGSTAIRYRVGLAPEVDWVEGCG